MKNNIDVRDLSEDDIEFVKKIVTLLRGRTSEKVTDRGTDKELAFGVWSLGVKNKISRREIYDYL